MIVKLANPITGATTVGISGVSGSPFQVVSFTGQPLTYGSGSSGEMLWMLFDGSRFQIINPPQALQANLTIYVNSSIGSDSYDGSQPTVSGTKGPLQHIQTAVNKAYNYPPSQYTITIQLADGTYNESVYTPNFPGPGLVINGHAGSPSNVLVTGANNAHTFAVNGPNSVTIQNLKVTTGTGIGPPCGFIAQGSGASLITQNTVSGFCQYSVHEAYGPCFVSIGNHTYAGNFAQAYTSFFGGFIGLAQYATYTIATPLTCSYWVDCSANGTLEVPVPGAPTFVNPGNVTGTKWLAQYNGCIITQGSGVNYFPGNVAGFTSAGGQYD